MWVLFLLYVWGVKGRGGATVWKSFCFLCVLLLVLISYSLVIFSLLFSVNDFLDRIDERYYLICSSMRLLYSIPSCFVETPWDTNKLNIGCLLLTNY